MRRFFLVALALLVVLVTGALLATQMPVEASPASAPVLQRGEDSPCVPEENKYIEPKVVLLGETTKVTLQATVLCAGETYPLHIVLVLDASGSMAGNPTKEMKEAAVQLVRDLDMRNNPQTEVGVVQFSSIAKTLSQLTNNEGRAVGAIRKVGASGGTAIDQGIKEGLKVLVRGRGGGASAGNIHEVMVVLSDGGNNAGCPPVLQAANQAKNQGVLMITICVGSGCDAQCMRQAASSPRYFFQVQNAGQLKQVFQQIRDELRNIILKKLTITDTLPDNMRYVPDSAEPEPDTMTPAGDKLTWDTNFVPKDGVTITFEVEPLEPGYWPTNVEARGDFKDNLNRDGSFIYGVPWVTVLRPDAIPTPTEPPPPPTATPTFTPGPTVTPTPTPTNTPTPRPLPIYLPILVWHPCEPSFYYSDVALVLDISTSMNRPTRTGRSKLAATMEKAKAFVDRMRFTPDRDGRHDQVAIVGFNRDAWIQQALSNDRQALHRAIERLPNRQEEFTRLDLALEFGSKAVEAPRHQPLNTKVIVLLTDGLPNQVPYDPEDGTMETTVLKKAQAAKLLGARLYTIAIGAPDDTNPELLKGVASEESLYYYEPDPEDLDRVYSEIVGTFGCPRSRLEYDSVWPPLRPTPAP